MTKINLKKPKKKFKELVVSQPNAQDGYEGLALTYKKKGRKKEALFFINEAMKKARKFIDEKMITELMGETLSRIQKMK